MCLDCWKSILEWDFFYQLQNLDTVIHNEIRHQSREIDIADTVYCVLIWKLQHQILCYMANLVDTLWI
jgi:hypothetical protein